MFNCHNTIHAWTILPLILQVHMRKGSDSRNESKDETWGDKGASEPIGLIEPNKSSGDA